MGTRQDLILATIRTGVPAMVGAFITWLISKIPAVADALAAIDSVLAVSAPGWTAVAILAAICIGLVTAIYYWIVRELGKRWPAVEGFLLGSAKQPLYQLVPVRLADGSVVFRAPPTT